jgi:signal peptidase I
VTADGEQSLRRHWWVAGLLSFLAIGLGQVYAGQVRWAAIVIAVWLGLLALFHTSLPSSFAGFALVYLSLVALQPVVIGHAAVTAWRNPVIARQPFHHWVFYVLYAGVALLILSGLAFGAFETVGGPSAFGGYKPFRMTSVPMEPTLRRGDYVMVKSASAADSDMGSYVGHVVVYVSEHTYIHRMVAVGGDRIAMQSGQVVVNGRVLPREALCTTPLSDSSAEAKLSVETNGARKYVVQNSTAEGAEYTAFLGERDEEVLEADQFFVIGDSRDYSNDSRSGGPLRNEQLVGRALYIFWSDDWSRIGRSLSPDAPFVRADYCGEPRP